ncbi:MAG: GNAT family N-acetyltransferase [Defluviitaleaceae bacterium]|nr:GNAT family N-acetyltransferase [Defluviitaleaceae bacterium]
MVANYKEILYDNEWLETERLILRKSKKSDASDIFEYASDEETVKYLAWEGAKTEDEALNGIINYHWANPGNWAIELKENQKCIGSIGITVVDSENEKTEFGYVLNRSYWNKGYASEALSAVLKLCFEKLELNRVEAIHYVGNEGSGKVMEKCGMKFEGISKQGKKVKGIFRDIVHYGIIKEHWHSKRSLYEQNNR